MKKTFIILFLFVFGLSINILAQGDLLITPKRIVFENNKKKKEMLNLVNIGSDTAVYSISFLNYKMNENGEFIKIEDEDSLHMFSSPYLRVFPRTVTLAPREPQVIALQYRKKPNMKSGEYRSHLYFRAEKVIAPLGDEIIGDTTKLKIQLIPVFGLSIPIILRTGEVNVTSTLSNLEIKMEQDTLHYLYFTINRIGNISAFGNISVEYIPEEGKPYKVGVVNGLGVYTDINKRACAVKLNVKPGTKMIKGILKIKYTSNDPFSNVVYAEAELNLENN